MIKRYSDDLRERVIEAVAAGASRREAAESFSLSASSGGRWLQRWRDTGSARAKLSGGGTSALEGDGGWAVGLIDEPTGLNFGGDGVADRQPTNSRRWHSGLRRF